MLGSSPNSSQRFAAALKKNLAESHRACRAIQVECRYLVKDLEVELKQEIVELVQEYDTKLKLAMSVPAFQGGTASAIPSPRQFASKQAIAEQNEGTKQLIQMFDGRVNALREDTRADIRAVERKFDAALRSQQEHMRQTRVMVEAIETSMSSQIESIVEDTQNAFVSAFNKYSALENTVAVLANKHNEMEAKMRALGSGDNTRAAPTAADAANTKTSSKKSSKKSSKANALRAVAMLTKKVNKKKSKKSTPSEEDDGAAGTRGNADFAPSKPTSDEIPSKNKKSSKVNALRAVAMLTKKVKKKKKTDTEKRKKAAEKIKWTKQEEGGLESDDVPSDAPSDAESLASLSSETVNSKKKEKGRRYKSRDAESDIKPPEGSLGQYILMSVKPYAKRPALVEASDTDVVVTYRALVNQVQSCAIALTYCGIQADSTIVVSLPSTMHIPIVCLATSLIGATCVLVSPHLSTTELRQISADVGGSDALFVTSAAAKASPDLVGSKKDGGFEMIVHVPMSEEDKDGGGDVAKKTSEDPLEKGDLEQYAYDELLTLGRAQKKAVPPPPRVKGGKSIALFMHSRRCRAEVDRLVGFSHAAIMSTIIALTGGADGGAGTGGGGSSGSSEGGEGGGGEFGPDDVVAVALPFWDARALCGIVLPALAAGACVVCPGAELTSADPSTILMVMTNHASGEDGGARINKMWVERRSMRFIARHHGKGSNAPLAQMFPSLRGLYTPDAEATVILEACAKVLGDDSVVCAVGGVVEMGGRVVSHLRSDASGQPYPTRMLPLLSGVECKILNPATKKMCAPGKRGLVMLKGPSMMAAKDYRNAERDGSM